MCVVESHTWDGVAVSVSVCVVCGVTHLDVSVWCVVGGGDVFVYVCVCVVGRCL